MIGYAGLLKLQMMVCLSIRDRPYGVQSVPSPNPYQPVDSLRCLAVELVVLILILMAQKNPTQQRFQIGWASAWAMIGLRFSLPACLVVPVLVEEGALMVQWG